MSESPIPNQSFKTTQPPIPVTSRVWKHCTICGYHRYATKTTACKHNIIISNTSHAPFVKDSLLCAFLSFKETSSYKKRYTISRDNCNKQASVLHHPHPTSTLALNPTTMAISGLKCLQLVTLDVATKQQLSLKLSQQQQSDPTQQVTQHKQQLATTTNLPLKPSYIIVPDSCLSLDTVVTHDLALKQHDKQACFITPLDLSLCSEADECVVTIKHENYDEEDDDDDDDDDEDDEEYLDCLHKLIRDSKCGGHVFEGQCLQLGARVQAEFTSAKASDHSINNNNNKINNNDDAVYDTSINVSSTIKKNKCYFRISSSTHLKLIRHRKRRESTNKPLSNPTETTSSIKDFVETNGDDGEKVDDIEHDLRDLVDTAGLEAFEWMGRGVRLLQWMCASMVAAAGGDGEVSSYRSCLLHASAASGKKSLVRAAAKHYKMRLYEVTVQEVCALDPEEFKTNLQKLARRLQSLPPSESADQPCILFFASLHSSYPASNNSNINHAAIFNHHLANMLRSNFNLFIIGSTSNLDLISSDLTQNRKGVFSLCIDLSDPGEEAKRKVLERLTGVKSADDLQAYSLSDLQHIALKVKMASVLEGVAANSRQLSDVIRCTPASRMKGVVLQNPCVKYDDIGGRDELKELLKQTITLSIRQPHLLSRTNLSPPKGLLLFGPPGCSKTMLAKAVASESGLNFIAVQGTSLHRMYVGETEACIRQIFQKARSSACVLFFDEVDAFAARRGCSTTASVQDRVMQQLLTEIDGCNKLNNVFVMAATNRPDLIDKAFLRPGRFDRCVYVPLPEDETRRRILSKRLAEAGCLVKGNESGALVGGNGAAIDLQILVEKTRGFSCAEVASITDEAWLLALERDPCDPGVTFADLLKVIEATRPSVSDQMVRWFEEYNAAYAH